ncbi:hypothetical protein K469DRAFT_696124 [Zopfia rhizophila CBS 207.26]|uniref:Uncharacterized protein n=1 Tax=Zopfia rhizophila CBS 207.26 TaxID=1314779 RepID=A0A6A6EKD2_9PEZI|nr:hypothetical protein K469DRAFT_696124 [Zopfia rhizophila CBS 207.26]
MTFVHSPSDSGANLPQGVRYHPKDTQNLHSRSHPGTQANSPNTSSHSSPQATAVPSKRRRKTNNPSVVSPPRALGRMPVIIAKDRRSAHYISLTWQSVIEKAQEIYIRDLEGKCYLL